MPFDALTFPAVTTEPTTLFRERRERACAAVLAVATSENFSIVSFIGRHTCGTTACFIGWMGLLKHDGWSFADETALAPGWAGANMVCDDEGYFGLSDEDSYAIFYEQDPLVSAATVAAQLLAAPYVLPAEG